MEKIKQADLILVLEEEVVIVEQAVVEELEDLYLLKE